MVMHLLILSPYTPSMGRVEPGFDSSTEQAPHLKCSYWALLLSANKDETIANIYIYIYIFFFLFDVAIHTVTYQ